VIEPRSLFEALELDLARVLEIGREDRLHLPPKARSSTNSTTSSLSTSERLSKFIVPTEDQIPSITNDFACSVDDSHS
jgi:hypothetical protein